MEGYVSHSPWDALSEFGRRYIRITLPTFSGDRASLLGDTVDRQCCAEADRLLSFLRDAYTHAFTGHEGDKHKRSARFFARVVTRLDAAAEARPSRLLHSLDGVGNEAFFRDVADAGELLWSRWREQHGDTDIDALLGLDAGGIIPTLGIARASGLPYFLAWKFSVAVPNGISVR